MRLRPALSLAAFLALAPAALAQEPPPPAPAPAPKPAEEKPAAPARHVNRISPEARALFDSIQKAAYSPVALGLKEMSGKMVMKVEMPGMEAGMEGMPDMSCNFAVDFKAPKTAVVVAKTDSPMFPPNSLDQMATGVKQLVLSGMGIFEPADDQEYDADVAAEAGAKVLVLTTYKDNQKLGEMRVTLDANGVPSKGQAKMKDPQMGMEQTVDMTFQYVKDGDRYRLEKQGITLSMMPEPMEYALTYTDTGAFKVVTGVSMKGPMGMTFGYRYTELTVNGKKVDLPAEPKKEAPKPATPTTPEKKEGEGEAK